MGSGYLISVDPAELSNRFAATKGNPEEDAEVPEADTDPIINALSYESQVKPLLNRIPEREADLIDLYYIQKKRQADIAEIFGVTQAAISYRLDRGLKRIKFLLSIPQLEVDQMQEDLPHVPFKPIDVDILIGMWLTTCQSEVAARLGLTQGRVRHRFFEAVKTLTKRSEEDERFVPYHKVFSAIASKNFNILREVRLPQWQNRGGNGCF